MPRSLERWSPLWPRILSAFTAARVRASDIDRGEPCTACGGLEHAVTPLVNVPEGVTAAGFSPGDSEHAAAAYAAAVAVDQG